MKVDMRQQQKENLKTLSTLLFQELKTEEGLALSYSGEDSLFIRVNQAKVRQASKVSQGYLSIAFFRDARHLEMAFSLTGVLEEDIKEGLQLLDRCRHDCEAFPEDPYVIWPEEGETSEEDHYGDLPPIETLPDAFLKPVKSFDLAGLFASSTLIRSTMNSKGQFHWFSTDNFSFDYSLYTPSQKAIKGIYAGKEWQDKDYLASIQQAKDQLHFLEHPPKKLTPGKYRVYFAPAAVAEIIMSLPVSGKQLMKGSSPLKKLYTGETTLSPLFSLHEDFSLGLVPRFNEWGEVSPLKIPLIHKGKLKSPLISQRTAKEYGLTSNAASSHEGLRSPRLHPGSLKKDLILSRLGTGLYISNLHYLSWSDLQHGRITGMTRYGCFWVERGEIISPIQDMRFDETLYHFWGDHLEDLSEHVELIPDVCSYGERSLGGIATPGMLVNDFAFTF